MKSILFDEILKAVAAKKKATAPALESARLKIAQRIAASKKVQAIPPTPEGQRVDCSPYK